MGRTERVGMSPRKVAHIDAVLLLVGLAAIAVGFVVTNKPGKPVLTVWSCGSNYESLRDFTARFEALHNCRVRYTAAPVQYLLEEALQTENPPDVMVGRAGPGWTALRKEGKLAHPPTFFAMDPYVIITPKENPAGIKDLVDLGRPGVRVAIAPPAMRPRGKCPAHLVAAVDEAFAPGLVERWENNQVEELRCGRNLAKPVVAGTAQAAIVPHCMTAWPSIRGKVQVIPIQAKYMLAMKQCRATIPQCCGILSTSKQPELAKRFVKQVTGELGERVFADHGYLMIDSPEARELADLMTVFEPADASGWQVHMANGLHEDEALGAALRRFLVVIHTFGPSQYDAQSRYWAGKCLQAMGQDQAARVQWRRVVDEFPRPGKLEWESKVLHVGKPVPGVKGLPDAHWVQAAREALAQPAGKGELSADHRAFFAKFALAQRTPTEGDPPKNGTRNLLLGVDLLEAGQYSAAARDLLKVLSLNYPSGHMREARFWLGAAAYLDGLPELAAGYWRALERGNDRWSSAAREALAMQGPVGDSRLASTPVAMPQWQSAYETHPERAMSYGMQLWRHQMPLFCFKEMAKILSGVYGKPGQLAPMARYRMGVCCIAMGKPQAAHSQWTLLRRCYPDSKRWVNLARRAQAKLPKAQRVDLPFVAKYATAQAIQQLKKAPKASFAQRLKGADELFDAEIFEGDQCLLEYWKAMTVTDPSQEKNKKIRPLAEFKAGTCCRKSGRESAARRHFQAVVDKYPGHPAARMARAALAKAGG